MTEQLKGKISILSQLANVDGNFDVRELAFIYNVCLRNDIRVDSIAEIITHPEPVISFDRLTDTERVSYLTDIFLLMMIDGNVLPKEIHFCKDIGRRLGFDPDSIQTLIIEFGDRTNIQEEYVKSRIAMLRLDSPE